MSNGEVGVIKGLSVMALYILTDFSSDVLRGEFILRHVNLRQEKWTTTGENRARQNTWASVSMVYALMYLVYCTFARA